MDPPVAITGAEGELIVSNDGRAMALWQDEPVVALWPALIEQWPYWLGAIAGLWLLIALIVMLLRYRRPRAVGQPHCRKCNYQLTGLTSDACPECGSALTKRNIIVGKRVRRRLILSSFLGAVLLTLGYTAMMLGGVPRTGAVGEWFDWHSAIAARWAQDREIDWLNDWQRDAHRLTVVDPTTGKTDGMATRRFSFEQTSVGAMQSISFGSFGQPRRFRPSVMHPRFSMDHRRLYLQRETDVLELDAATLRDGRVFATQSGSNVVNYLTNQSGDTLMLLSTEYVRHHGGSFGPSSVIHVTLDRFALDDDSIDPGRILLPDGTRRVWSPPGWAGLVAMAENEWGYDRRWWVSDEQFNWTKGRGIPDHLDLSRADFTHDGRHVLIPSERTDYIMRDKLLIIDAQDGRRTHMIEFGQPVPGFTVSESRRWLITWGEDDRTGERGIEILSLNTGKLIHTIPLGKEVTIDRAWEAQNEPTLIIQGRTDRPGQNHHLLWRYDLTTLLAAHPTDEHGWDTPDTPRNSRGPIQP